MHHELSPMKAREVQPLEGYKRKVTFDGGVSGIVDLNDLISKGVFRQLQDVAVFRNEPTDGTAIAWFDELEIDVDNIDAEIQQLTPAQLSV
jgi:hypothetical protein